MTVGLRGQLTVIGSLFLPCSLRDQTQVTRFTVGSFTFWAILSTPPLLNRVWHLCVCECMHMSASVWKPAIHVGYLPLWLLPLSFWDTIFHWASSSLVQLDELPSKSLIITSLQLPTANITMCAAMLSLVCGALGNWTQFLMAEAFFHLFFGDISQKLIGLLLCLASFT